MIRFLKKIYALVIGIGVVALLIFPLFFKTKLTIKVSTNQSSLSELPSDSSRIHSIKEHRLKIVSGQTLVDLLIPFFPFQLINEIIAAAKPVYNLNRIRAGHDLVIKTSNQGDFYSLTYEIDPGQFLEIKKETNGLKASLQSPPLETRLSFLTGEINESLIEAINQLGERDSLALSLAEIFAWEIDFYLDLRAGDIFAFIFEKKYLQGEFIGYGDILAAQIINQGKKYQAYRFRHPKTGKIDYFDAEGKSLRKAFLRSPIKYGRITSRFSLRRRHPIHKIYRPHYGIDYAAPIGTPVQATADGLVTFAGRNGASGRMIRLRHKNGYESLYLHLHQFAPGIKVGAQVKAGDIIGYVGSSGESTGPHLDYRLLYHGRYINPLAWRFESSEPLPPEFLDSFKNEIKSFAFFFDRPYLFARLLTF
ncbi:MAG: M23 family metallopeptidase [Candidatus Aminicenantes bacterium]|nr:M23 family metallopeptidase [Candidatus Aminicenantes bacterium]